MGFLKFATADLSAAVTHLFDTTGGSVTLSSNGGPTGNRAFVSNSAGDRGIFQLPAAKTNVGFAQVKVKAVAFGTGNKSILTVYDSAGAVQIAVQINDELGTISVLRGTTIVGTSAPLVTDWLTVWHTIRISWFIDNAAGFIRIRIDNSTATDYEFTGDTQQTANANWQRVDMLGAVGTGSTDTLYTDCVVWDEADTGDGFTTWRMPLTPVVLLPNATVTNTSATRTGADSGSDHGQVDEQVPNGATDGIQTATLGGGLRLGYPDPSLTGPIALVLACPQVQNPDGGAANHTAVAHLGGSSTTGDTKSAAASFHTAVIPLARPGGGSWSQQDLHDAEFEFKKVS